VISSSYVGFRYYCLSVPRHDVTEVSSSSYGLSLFSSKAGSPPEENTGSSSVSVRVLWPEIDLLDEAVRRGTSMVLAWGLLGDQTSRSRMSPQGSRKQDEGSSRIYQKAPIDGAPGSPSAPLRDYGGGSVKNKAARILANASGVISPWM
jgi:hypothetical protein